MICQATSFYTEERSKDINDQEKTHPKELRVIDIVASAVPVQYDYLVKVESHAHCIHPSAKKSVIT